MSDHCCSNHSSGSMVQSLSELEFERGLWGAALEDDLPKVQSLLNKGTPPSIRDSSGYTPLHYAVRQSSEALIVALLEKGADPNAQTPSGLTSPLHRAAARGRTKIVKLLLDYGGDSLLADADQRTALHHCCLSNPKEGPLCAKILISKDPNCRKMVDKNGMTPFQLIPVMTEDWNSLIQ